MDSHTLIQALIYLGSAALIVPIAVRLGLGSVLGYLIAGCIIGPWGLRLVTDAESILHFAEIGVVLMLFIIGLELDPQRLWKLRAAVFGGGALQMVICGGLLGLFCMLLGLRWQVAELIGMTLALSSTAIAMQAMNERNLMMTQMGRSAFAVLLFQDIAAIPLVAMIPLLAASSASTTMGAFALSALKVAGALVLVVLLALAVGGALLFAHNEISGNGRPGTEVTVSIPQGSGVSVIAQKLKDAGVIRSAYLFRWYVGQKGAASKLQYGDFTLQKSACSYDAIIAVLSTYAKAETVRVTVPEGTTAIAIAQKMEAAGLCSAEDFLKEANEGDFSEYTFWQYVPDDADAPDRFMKCEGYLFPETYEFLKDDTVHNYVATFYAQFDAQITDEMYAELKKQDMTLPQLITLASFVQEEAGNSQDSNVAQVFRNRLAADSPYPRLQSNTSSYIQSDSDNNYLWNWVAPYYGGWDHIPENIVAAYDTYSCKGLPAGPISNPGIAAIRAALAPQPNEEAKDAYFFVTDLKGSYYYARTLSEHNANCQKAAQVNKTVNTEK